MIGCPPTAAAKHEAGKGAVLQISSIPLPAGATGCSMIVAEARTAASAAGVAAAAAAAAAPAAGAAATIAEAVAMEEPASPQSTSSWALVEPWSSLLLAGGSLGEEGGDDAQVSHQPPSAPTHQPFSVATCMNKSLRISCRTSAVPSTLCSRLLEHAESDIQREEATTEKPLASWTPSRIVANCGVCRGPVLGGDEQAGVSSRSHRAPRPC